MCGSHSGEEVYTLKNEPISHFYGHVGMLGPLQVLIIDHKCIYTFPTYSDYRIVVDPIDFYFGVFVYASSIGAVKVVVME